MQKEGYGATLGNIQAVQDAGGTVAHSIDATALEERLGTFKSIIFNFPHTGGDIVSNQLLLRNFLQSAKTVLQPGGTILHHP